MDHSRTRLEIICYHHYMSETGFNPEGLARTIAGREVGANRLDPILGKLEKLTHDYVEHQTVKAGLETRNAYSAISPEKKGNTEAEISFDDSMRQSAERAEKWATQSYGGRKQGEYEEKIAQASTEKDKARVQKSFEEEFSPQGIKKELYGYRDAFGERQYATPLETVYHLATVENQLFDTVKQKMINSGEIKDAKNLTNNEHQEIQKKIDKQLRQIGMDLLRGITLPAPVGQILVDRAKINAEKLLKVKSK